MIINTNDIDFFEYENLLPEYTEEDERHWMEKAVASIKNPVDSIRIKQEITRCIEALYGFSSDQIVHVVKMFEQRVRQEITSEEIRDHLTQEIVGVMVLEKIPLEEYFKEGSEKCKALESVIEAVKARKLDPVKAAQYLQNSGVDARGLEIQKVLIEIAKLGAKNNIWSISEKIGQFGIDTSRHEGKQALIEIAMQAAKYYGSGISRYIKNYGFEASTSEEQKVLIEIAKISAKYCACGTSEYIKNYGIDASTPEGKNALIEIAMLAASTNGAEISKHIKNYGIDASSPEGQKTLIEIAKLAAKNNGMGTSEYIKNYGIDRSTSAGRNALIEIAMLATRQCGVGTTFFIKNYEIDRSTSEGRNALIEIAKLSAQLCAVGTSEHIANYGFDAASPEGLKVLVEIAMLAARQSGRGISLYIKNYGIDASSPQGQKILIEIAKLAAQQSGGGTSEYIKNYGIDSSSPEGQKALFDIAMLAAQRNGRGTSQHIKNYGIDASSPEGQKALIEIAKEAARASGGGTSEHIRNYGIDSSTPEGQNALIEIAKLAARQNGEGTSEFIRKYRIHIFSQESQPILIEIAKLAAQQNGRGTSKHINMYMIDFCSAEGQKALIEIAKLAAVQNGPGTLEWFSKYGIAVSVPEGQNALIEIAKLSAAQNGLETSLFIVWNKIKTSVPEGQKAMVEIAKLAARNHGQGVSEHIRNYGLNAASSEGQEALLEIAKLAAQQNAIGTLENLDRYLLDTESEEGKLRYNDLLNICFISLVRQFSDFRYRNFSRFFKRYVLECKDDSDKMYRVNLNNFLSSIDRLKAGDIHGALQEAVTTVAFIYKMNTEDLQWVQRVVSAVDNQDGKLELLEQFMSLASLCATRQDLKQLFRDNGPLFERIALLSSGLRIRFMQEVIASSLQPNSLFVGRLKSEIFKKHSIVKKIAVLPRDLRLAVLEVFLRGCYDDQATRVKGLQAKASDIVHAQLACYILAEFPLAGEEVYVDALDIIKNERNFRDAKYQQPLLLALLTLKSSDLDDKAKIVLLKNIFKNISSKDLIRGLQLITDIINFKGKACLGEVSSLSSLQSTLEQLFIQKCKLKVDNFGALYQESIGKWRNKEALLTYAGKQVEDAKVLPYFQAFLLSVLQGKFLQVRYATQKNHHLEYIKHHQPKIFEGWQLSACLTEDEIALKGPVKTVSKENRVVDILKRAVEDRHLGLERQAKLFPILSSCADNWHMVKNALNQILEELKPLSNRPLTGIEIQQKQLLQLQKAVLELVLEPSDLEDKLNRLKACKITGLDEVLSPFYQDLKDAAKLLHATEKSSSDTYKVIDSDDPNHFLLMGTEVLNSCQKVHGSASLNVGLLGFALDGKHRLALVCDPSGKILARSVLRLLLDAKGNPVLFQERVYVADPSPAYPNLLRKLAIKKAAMLGVPLLVSPSDFEKEQAEPYAHFIEAKDKPVPFEYVDALRGIQRGPYMISNTLQIRTDFCPKLQ